MGSQYSLRNPQVWSYVWRLASKGRVAAILGGPDRWHLPHLHDYELNLVNSDTALCLRQMALWVRSQECKRWDQDVGMLLESPHDPASYLKDEEEVKTAPSF